MMGKTGGRAAGARVSMWPGVALAVVLAGFAFVSSFDALRIVFRASGMSGDIAWMGPLCVDGIVGLCTMSVWWFKKLGIGSTWYPWAGFLLFGALSVVGNMLHAHPVTVDGTTLPWWAPPVIMSIPPVAFMYATHLLVIVATRRLAVRVPMTASDGVADDDGDTASMDALAAVSDPVDPVGPDPVAHSPAVPSFPPVAQGDPVSGPDVPDVSDVSEDGGYRPTLVFDSFTPGPSDASPFVSSADDRPFDRLADDTPEPERDPIVERPAPATPVTPVATLPEPAVSNGSDDSGQVVRDAGDPVAPAVPDPVDDAGIGDGEGEAGDREASEPTIGDLTLAEWHDYGMRLLDAGVRPVASRVEHDGLAPSLSTAKRYVKELREIMPDAFPTRR